MQDDLTGKIIGCAYKVYNQLGFGFQESVYQKSMLIELAKQGLKASEEVGIAVYYDNQNVGNFFADIVVENELIVELKSVQKLQSAYEVQLVNYLVATKTETGLLINFGPDTVEIKRKFRTYKKTNS
ncbi:MAG: GxxExxY protein [Planctomycetaceae bacterium]|jgi:GxxExxY protein|nr:GxxExxY protein [Planctomycetaceae bacterium]